MLNPLVTVGNSHRSKSNKKEEVLEGIVDEAKRLMIKVINGEKEEKIELNAAGYSDSLRKAFDGVTYFGNDKNLLVTSHIKVIGWSAERLYISSSK